MTFIEQKVIKIGVDFFTTIFNFLLFTYYKITKFISFIMFLSVSLEENKIIIHIFDSYFFVNQKSH